MSNRFDGVEKESIQNLIAQLVGAGSSPALWSGGVKGIFESEKAVQIVAEGTDKLREMLEDRLVQSGAVDPNDVEMLVGIILDLED